MKFKYINGMQIVSIISVTSSLAVMCTLLFKSLRRKLFMQIIALIAFSDLIANLPYISVRRPSDGSPLCDVEGFINIYFYPVSWLWTTVLMGLLYSLATTGKLPLSYVALHAICWLFPLLLTLLNFALMNGDPTVANGGHYQYEVCSLDNSSTAFYVYHLCTYYGLWFLTIGIMLGMYLRIRALDRTELRTKFPMWQAARDTLILYPLALFVCWAPHLVSVILVDFTSLPDMSLFYFIADVIKVTHGTITAAIFFYKSSEARSRWRAVFFEVNNHTRRLVGLPPIERAAGAPQEVANDFSVEYDEDRESAVQEARPWPSDDKTNYFDTMNSHNGNSSRSVSSTTPNVIFIAAGGGRNQSKDSLRASLLEMA